MPSKKKAAIEATPVVTEEIIETIKGFNTDWTCRGFKFELGQSYTHAGTVEVCHSGFHGIQGHPLSVFQYYPPNKSRYAETKQGEKIARDGDGSKIASATITIGVEIKLHELIERAVKWVFDRAKWSDGPSVSGNNEGATASGESGAATASGWSGAATASGWYGAATASGWCGAATASGESGAATASGWSGAATASGWCGAATASGESGAATASGRYGAATASGRYGAATASGESGAATASGESGAATASGRYGAATASGRYGAATASGESGAATASGESGAATASGRYGAATASGWCGKVQGAMGCALFLTYRDPSTWEILHAWAGIAGRDGIKADTWYQLTADGKPVEVAL